MNEPPLPLLRLLQIADSSFPVGGYAYSHGLEWLVAERRVVDEPGLSEFLETFLAQTVRRHWLPAAAGAFRANTPALLSRIDVLFDASIVPEPERRSGRAMGRQLHQLLRANRGLSSSRFPLTAFPTADCPSQYAIVFAAVARAFAIEEEAVLAALGHSLVSSVTQAAVRLGVIGAHASARLVTQSLPTLARAASDVSATPRPRFGSFAPTLELASMLQPSLKFRMFAS